MATNNGNILQDFLSGKPLVGLQTAGNDAYSAFTNFLSGAANTVKKDATQAPAVAGSLVNMIGKTVGNQPVVGIPGAPTWSQTSDAITGGRQGLGNSFLKGNLTTQQAAPLALLGLNLVPGVGEVADVADAGALAGEAGAATDVAAGAGALRSIPDIPDIVPGASPDVAGVTNYGRAMQAPASGQAGPALAQDPITESILNRGQPMRINPGLQDLPPDPNIQFVNPENAQFSQPQPPGEFQPGNNIPNPNEPQAPIQPTQAPSGGPNIFQKAGGAIGNTLKNPYVDLGIALNIPTITKGVTDLATTAGAAGLDFLSKAATGGQKTTSTSTDIGSVSNRYSLDNPYTSGNFINPNSYSGSAAALQQQIGNDSVVNPIKAQQERGQLSALQTQYDAQTDIRTTYTNTNAAMGAANFAYQAVSQASPDFFNYLSKGYNALQNANNPAYGSAATYLQALQAESGVDFTTANNKQTLQAKIDSAVSILKNNYQNKYNSFFGQGNTQAVPPGPASQNTPGIVTSPQQSAIRGAGLPANFSFGHQL